MFKRGVMVSFSFILLLTSCKSLDVKTQKEVEVGKKSIEVENVKAENVEAVVSALDDIEVINSETGEKRLDLVSGQKVKLKAIPHAYDEKGNDLKDSVVNFNPEWSADYGTFIPGKGSEVMYVLPHNLKGVAQFFIHVSQKNEKDKLIEANVWVNVNR